ncbi:MAG: anion transporter [Deltaproteobacteria bacterium]|nr:anion transporter [Deltaproteobacteria bacterium]
MLPSGYFPVFVLFVVFLLIAVRQIGTLRLKIWQIMAGGAVIVVASGSIAPGDAVKAIDLDVMVFLFGMFVVGEALIRSGYLYHISHDAFRHARSPGALVFSMLFVIGGLSALLMNDTLAVIGTPLAVFIAEKYRINCKLLLLTVCFATTIGSVASPIGNPQNLLVAINGPVAAPFATFFKYLALPTALNLVIAFYVLKAVYRRHFSENEISSVREEIGDSSLAGLARLSLMIILAMAVLKAASFALGNAFDFRLTYIAVAAAMPVIILSRRRGEILRSIDWPTLVFFAALFILMESVWRAGVIQPLIASQNLDLASPGLILALSVTLSQVLSNVPFVALYLPVLNHLGANEAALMALAAGSTIAGNLFILGAASNVIVIQNAEKRGHTITFFEFAKAGVPLTAINVFVYWVWFALIR